MTSIRISGSQSLGSTPPVREVLEGVVQKLTLFGPGGEAPPSGLYLILSKPVQIAGQSFDRVYLSEANLSVGGHYVLAGDLSAVSKRGVVTTVRYAVLANAQKLEVEPPQSMQRPGQS